MPFFKMEKSVRVKFAINAFLLHFLFGVFIALFVAIFLIPHWYPYPFDKISGIWSLFLIIFSVDVVCGPLLTAIVFNPLKTRRELVFDISIIISLRSLIFFCGIYALIQARPVVIAFEVDRFVVVSASEVRTKELKNAYQHLNSLSWRGPLLIGVRDPVDSEERLNSISLSLSGLEPSLRPGWWQDYEQSRLLAKTNMRKLSTLYDRLDNEGKKLILNKSLTFRKDISDLNYFPLVGKNSFDSWSVVVDRDASVVGYVPFGGFDY